MFELTSAALIHATRERVYDLIADVDRYADWNPWNFEAWGGPAEAGNIVTMSVKLGRRTLRVAHEVLESSRGERLVWRDLGWFTALASGERARELTPDPAGTRYRVVLTITGPFAWLVRLWFGRDLAAGLQQETDALKAAAEAR